MIETTIALGPTKVAPKTPKNPHEADVTALLEAFNKHLTDRDFDESVFGENPKKRRLVVKINYEDELDAQPPEYKTAVLEQARQHFIRAGWTEVFLLPESDPRRVHQTQLVLTLEVEMPVYRGQT